MAVTSPATDPSDSYKTLTIVIYVLQAASMFLVVTIVVAVILNYVKRGDVEGSWLASHFRWQIRTFWFGMLWMVVGLVGLYFFIGFFILIANGVWVLYRIIRGLLRLHSNLPMYT